MELLLTGWVAALSAPFCRRLTEEHKLVVAAKQIPSVDLGARGGSLFLWAA